MKRAPSLISAYSMLSRPSFYQFETTNMGSAEVPCRPMGMYGFHRVKLAWGVLTGKYDALVWPGQEGFNKTIEYCEREKK